MRATLFDVEADAVRATVIEAPAWEPRAEYDGLPLSGVRATNLVDTAEATVQLVEIAAGGSFALHTSPDLAFCQVVRGAGVLGLPGGRSLPYRGPELYVFEPGSLHEWRDVEEDTLLSVCLVRLGG